MKTPKEKKSKRRVVSERRNNPAGGDKGEGQGSQRVSSAIAPETSSKGEIMQGENRKKADQREEEVHEKGPAREPGTNQGSRKPSREEIRKTPNRTGKEVEPLTRMED